MTTPHKSKHTAKSSLTLITDARMVFRSKDLRELNFKANIAKHDLIERVQSGFRIPSFIKRCLLENHN